MVQRQVRARGTLDDPRRIGLVMESRAHARLRELSAAAGTSHSAIVQWLVDRVEVDENGVPAGWAEEHPRQEGLLLADT